MYFFISKVKISLQMVKFPGNDLAKMPIFSHHEYHIYTSFQTLNMIIYLLLIQKASKNHFQQIEKKFKFTDNVSFRENGPSPKFTA